MIEILYIVGFLVVLLIGYLIRNKSTLSLIYRLILIFITGLFLYISLSNKDKKEEELQRKIDFLELKQRTSQGQKDEGVNVKITEKIEIINGVEKKETTTIKNGTKTINKTERKISVFGE